MSRIGKLPITLPANVTLEVKNQEVTVKGPKGTLTQHIHKSISVSVNDNEIVLERSSEEKQVKAYHGLYRSLINNMVIGVSEGYKVEQELVGVGYRANVTGQQLELSLGFSHNLVFVLPDEIKASSKSERGANPLITLESHDKQLIGMVAAKIRSFRKPEPYKGKGVKFVGEVIRRKAGKSAAKK